MKSIYSHIKSALVMKKIIKNINRKELEKKAFVESQYKGRDYFDNNDTNLKFYNLKEDDYRICYDSTWTVDVMKDGKMHYLKLTLDDCYHLDAARVMKELIDCKTTYDIEKLDQREKIYYD